MKKSQGFSLIEMAFVLVIITLLLGGLLVPFTTQVEQRRIAETNKAMEEIKEALLGYAVANGRLPCPAADAINGIAQANCPLTPPDVSVTGFLPWATLGIARSDAWGRLYRYAVTANFATPFTLDTDAKIDLQTRASDGSLTTLASSAVAVVISHGKNGYGGKYEGGVNDVAPVPAPNTDEMTNASGTHGFVARPLVPPSSPCGAAGQPLCEFDDLVVWLSPNVLFNRMVAAGKLP